MTTVLLIVVPLLAGFVSFFLKEERSAKAWALLSTIVTLAISLVTLTQKGDAVTCDASWLPMLGSRFTVSLDGMGKVLTLLTAVSFTIIFAATYRNTYKNANAFYGFML